MSGSDDEDELPPYIGARLADSLHRYFEPYPPPASEEDRRQPAQKSPTS